MNGDQQHQPAPESETTNWQYTAQPPSQYTPPLTEYETPPQPIEGLDEVTWTASEFVAHHKSALWFVSLGALTLAVVVLVHLLTHDILSIVVVVGLAVLFGISAARQPRTLQYRLDQHGITIGPKFYAYTEFRSFSVMQEGPLSSLNLLPLRRFMPTISIYYDSNDEARIVEVITKHLAFEPHTNDVVDRITRRIRF